MNKTETKDRVAWSHGFSYWNTKQILFEGGPKLYLRMFKQARKLNLFLDLYPNFI